VQVHVVVERRTEAMQKGNAAEPRTGSIRCVGSSVDTGGREQQPLDLWPNTPATLAEVEACQSAVLRPKYAVL
jgi:hypothetical protein